MNVPLLSAFLRRYRLICRGAAPAKRAKRSPRVQKHESKSRSVPARGPRRKKSPVKYPRAQNRTLIQG